MLSGGTLAHPASGARNVVELRRRAPIRGEIAWHYEREGVMRCL